MRERKCVKFRVDMYEDTKFKIIDMKPERDVIHYVWNRIVLLAGKVNLEGELYLSKSIPHTVKTLAIEFNRDIAQIKLALDIFIELEMVVLNKEKIYKVVNFAKHQNIKVKEKETSNNKEADLKNTEEALNKNLKIEIVDDKGKDTESEHRTMENAVESCEASKGVNWESTDTGAAIVDNIIEDKSSGDNLQKDDSILLDTNKGRKRNKKKKDNVIDINVTDEEVKDDSVNCFTDGDRTLENDESIVLGWSFG